MSGVKIKIPIIEFSRDWPPQSLAVFSDAAKSLKRLAVATGTRSDTFRESCLRLREAFKVGGTDLLLQKIERPVDVRAIFHLIVNEPEIGTKIETGKDFCRTISKASPYLGTLALLTAIQCFFQSFSDSNNRKALANLIRQEIEKRPPNKLGIGLRELSQHKELIFHTSGPEKTVEFAEKKNREFEQIVKLFGLKPYDSTAFVKQCRGIYYLSQIKSLPKNTKSSVLAEIQQEEVYLAPYDDGQMLGHAIIREVLKKFRRDNLIPDQWLDVILQIGGDPRVPRGSREYQQWWTFFNNEERDQVLAALSGLDLEIFLTALRDFAEKSPNSDLKRMFAARETFLRGLLSEGLIKKSRMFLARDTIRYIERNFDETKMPKFSRIEHQDKSLIYLDLGFCEILEGSYSCKFWIYDELPEAGRVQDYSKSRFSYSELTRSMQGHYQEKVRKNNGAWGNFNLPIAIRHNPPVSWQANVLLEMHKLPNAPRFNTEALFSKKDYAQYKKLHMRAH